MKDTCEISGAKLPPVELTPLERELLLGCQGALMALILAPHVDKQQAIDYLKEVIAKAEARK